MPFINDKYVEYDPETLAAALAAGKNIRPHYYDYEDSRTQEMRRQQEWDAINKVLKQKHNDTWRKYNDPSWTPTETPGLRPLPETGMNMASATGTGAQGTGGIDLQTLIAMLTQNNRTNFYDRPKKSIQDRINESDALVNFYGV